MSQEITQDILTQAVEEVICTKAVLIENKGRNHRSVPYLLIITIP